MSENLDRLIDEMKGCRDAAEQLYLVLEHARRNREELRPVLVPAEGTESVPDVISCVSATLTLRTL